MQSRVARSGARTGDWRWRARLDFSGGQDSVFGQQLFRGFAPGRIERNAGNRAHLLTLRFIEVADALGAFIGIDLVVLEAHRNCFVGTFGFADIAIDAVVGNQESHGASLANQAEGGANVAILLCSQRSTDGNTNFDTSPPSMAISRTMVPEIN